VIEVMLDDLEASVEEVKQKYYGVTVGQVINLLDPLFLGRVQIRLPFIDSLDLEPWARVAHPMAGIQHGFYFVPNMLDEVLVAFEHGDVNVPYIIGSLWNAMAPPPLPSPVPQIRAIRTLTGNQLVFTEVPPSVTLQTAPTPPVTMPMPPSPVGPHQSVSLNPLGIQVMTPIGVQIAVGDTMIIVDLITGVTITSAKTIKLAANAISLTATAAVSITGATVSITGGLVKIN
jgi:hypothetical protein